MKSFLIFAILLIAKSSVASIPTDLQKCKFGDVQCIAQTATSVANKNPHGSKDYNLPNLEPLRIHALNIGQGGEKSSLNLNINLKDVDMFGLSTIHIDRVVGFGQNPASSKFEVYATIPKLHLVGKYKANGRILVLPIQGEGPCDISLYTVKVSIKLKPQVTTKNGKTYIQIEKLKMLLEPSKVTYRLDNLFNGDKALGDNMNTFLNENWKDVWTDIEPDIDSDMAEIIKSIISNTFKIGAYDDLFLPD